MIIIPAIDLKDGRCVRLLQGRADDVTVYSEDPVAMAGRWLGDGARYLHVVDLDGAFQGKPVHTKVIAEIVNSIDIPVEVGGGLRSDDDVKTLLDSGVARVILGTRAIGSADVLKALAASYPGQIVVGIDARDGLVQVSGWVEATELDAYDLAQRVEETGVNTVIFTDIATDGMMTGVNVEAVDRMCSSVCMDVVASGGISTVDDVKKLKELGKGNLSGAIVGKALYEESVTLSELQGV